MTATTEINGVPVDKLRATIAKVTDDPDLAQFRFTARNTWIEGTASRSVMHEWYGAGADQLHAHTFQVTADHPTLGHGHGATPHEHVLHALAACLVAGIATAASARDIRLHSVETVVRGSIDVRGILGVDRDVRNGFRDIDVQIDVKGDATDVELALLVESSRRRSAVYDILVNPTTVSVAKTS